MGAEFTDSYSTKEDIQEAWLEIVDDALYWNGHGGYTGTLAEKRGFVVLNCEAADIEEAVKLAYDIDNECIEHVLPELRAHPVHTAYTSDKWGPAGAIKVKDAGWLFFGWCSS